MELYTKTDVDVERRSCSDDIIPNGCREIMDEAGMIPYGVA